METATDHDLALRRLLDEGNLRRAAELLVDVHTREVLGLCRAMVRDASAAEDLAQDVFSRAFASLDSFRSDASSRTWILAIARNRCIDHLRARKRDPWAGAAGDDALEPDRHPDDAPLPPDLLARRGEVQAALAALGEGERALVVLRFAHGLGYGELAETFGIRPGTARMRVSRALARMREALEAPAVDQISTLEAAPPSARRRAPTPQRPGAPPAPAAPGAPPPSLGSERASSAAARTSSRAARARSRGLLDRIFGGAGSGSAEEPAGAPRTAHPLADYFAAVDDRVSDTLLARLRRLARSI